MACQKTQKPSIIKGFAAVPKKWQEFKIFENEEMVFRIEEGKQVKTALFRTEIEIHCGDFTAVCRIGRNDVIFETFKFKQTGGRSTTIGFSM